jgi:6-pyruvoyltetrahydropterin/6-carboxytetrahydropterin synthase
MYEISVTRVFAAGHAIRLYDGSLEPMHGHNWNLVVTVAAGELDAMEVVMDFHLLERLVDALVARVHNRCLNEVAPFADETGQLKVNPTAERVAWWFATEVARGLPAGVTLLSASVSEAPGCTALYRL